VVKADLRNCLTTKSGKFLPVSLSEGKNNQVNDSAREIDIENGFDAG
jgi:hypothetical protein